MIREAARGGKREVVLDDQDWLALLWEHTSDAMALSDEEGIVLRQTPRTTGCTNTRLT